MVKTINDSKELTKELLKLELKIFNRTNVIEDDIIESLHFQWVRDCLLFKSEEVLENINPSFWVKIHNYHNYLVHSYSRRKKIKTFLMNVHFRNEC